MYSDVPVSEPVSVSVPAPSAAGGSSGETAEAEPIVHLVPWKQGSRILLSLIPVGIPKPQRPGGRFARALGERHATVASSPFCLVAVALSLGA